MEQRLDFYKANPAAVKALIGVEERIGKSALEKSLTELVRLRASRVRVNGSKRTRFTQSPTKLTVTPEEPIGLGELFTGPVSA